MDVFCQLYDPQISTLFLTMDVFCQLYDPQIRSPHFTRGRTTTFRSHVCDFGQINNYSKLQCVVNELSLYAYLQVAIGSSLVAR